MNGGLLGEAYSLNARMFALETELLTARKRQEQSNETPHTAVHPMARFVSGTWQEYRHANPHRQSGITMVRQLRAR
jgi:hypothetical protein